MVSSSANVSPLAYYCGFPLRSFSVELVCSSRTSISSDGLLATLNGVTARQVFTCIHFSPQKRRNMPSDYMSSAWKLWTAVAPELVPDAQWLEEQGPFLHVTIQKNKVSRTSEHNE